MIQASEQTYNSYFIILPKGVCKLLFDPKDNNTHFNFIQTAILDSIYTNYTTDLLKLVITQVPN